MIFIIAAILLGYKKGRDADRNRYLWALIAGVAFLVGQTFGEIILGPTYLILIPAILAVVLVFRILDKTSHDNGSPEPPPPPTFDNAE